LFIETRLKQDIYARLARICVGAGLEVIPELVEVVTPALDLRFFAMGFTFRQAQGQKVKPLLYH